MQKNKVALVTGAGSGIGKSVSISLSENGFSVVLTGRRREKLEETASFCPGNTLVVPADLTEEADVIRLFDELVNHYGRLDLLFNNAGTNVSNVPLDTLTFDQWKLVLDTNLTSAFLCTRSAFRLMKSQTPYGGRIINNGSVSAHSPRPDSSPYTASKHGITGLTKSTALDGRKYRIACGQIDIGNAATDLASRMATGVPQADGRIAIEPLIDLKHVADAILYMANLPLDANVLFMTVMATEMPLVGRG